MSFTLSYNHFFTVRVLDADSGLPIEGIAFIPSEQCAINLNKHRLTFKIRTGGFDVFYQQNPEALVPLLAPINQRTKFSFGFVISDPNFFTKYEPDLDNPPQLYLDNLDSTGTILAASNAVLSENAEVELADTAKIYATTFSITTDLTQAPVPTLYDINEKHNPANTLQSVAIDNPLGLDQVVTKLNDTVAQAASFISAAGPYLLESDSGQPATRTIYLDDQLVRENITGIVDIYWENSQDTVPPGGNNYEIRFKLK